MNIKTLFAAAAFAGAVFVASQASAMPVAPQSSGSGVEQVSMRGREVARRNAHIRRLHHYERRRAQHYRRMRHW